jgi:hypothetical protein
LNREKSNKGQAIEKVIFLGLPFFCSQSIFLKRGCHYLLVTFYKQAGRLSYVVVNRDCRAFFEIAMTEGKEGITQVKQGYHGASRKGIGSFPTRGGIDYSSKAADIIAK